MSTKVNKNENAKRLAYEAHDGQFRKFTGEPYIVHPEQVHNKVTVFCGFKELEEEKKELMQRASWLHDVIEDCSQISNDRIVSETDEETLNLVLELTNPSKGSKEPRAVRKKMDRDHLATVSWEAKVIKLCDRIVNLYDMQHHPGFGMSGPDKSFVALYAKESRALLEVLRGTDEVLELELFTAIASAEEWSK